MSSPLTSQAPEAHRILFAEDHPAARKIMKAYMTDAGYVVHAADDGAAALQLFQNDPREYDVLITDHEMPGLNGVELVEKLRAAQFTGKIVVVSGALTSEVEGAYRALQVDRILTKPVKCAVLIKLIQDLCAPAAGLASMTLDEVGSRSAGNTMRAHLH